LHARHIAATRVVPLRKRARHRGSKKFHGGVRRGAIRRTHSAKRIAVQRQGIDFFCRRIASGLGIGEEPGVLDRDRRDVGEALQGLDLGEAESVRPPVHGVKEADDICLPKERDGEASPDAFRRGQVGVVAGDTSSSEVVLGPGRCPRREDFPADATSGMHPDPAESPRFRPRPGGDCGRPVRPGTGGDRRDLAPEEAPHGLGDRREDLLELELARDLARDAPEVADLLQMAARLLRQALGVGAAHPLGLEQAGVLQGRRRRRGQARKERDLILPEAPDLVIPDRQGSQHLPPAGERNGQRGTDPLLGDPLPGPRGKHE
jgi:hypothetical protein